MTETAQPAAVIRCLAARDISCCRIEANLEAGLANDGSLSRAATRQIAVQNSPLAPAHPGLASQSACKLYRYPPWDKATNRPLANGLSNNWESYCTSISVIVDKLRFIAHAGGAAPEAPHRSAAPRAQTCGAWDESTAENCVSRVSSTALCAAMDCVPLSFTLLAGRQLFFHFGEPPSAGVSTVLAVCLSPRLRRQPTDRGAATRCTCELELFVLARYRCHRPG